MAVQIARPSDMMMRDPLQGPRFQPTPTPQQRPEPSAMEQFGQMAQNRAMESALDTGSTMMQDKVITPMFSGAAPTANVASQVGGATAAEIAAGAGGEAIGTMAANAATPALTQAAGTAAGTAAGAGAGAAGAGMMATIGTAVPYIGAGLLAGKALGLFSDGGYVGPLYAADGTRGVEQQLKTGKRQDMSKGPIGLLNMFVKGVDALTGYDRANEKRADLPEGKRDMLINKRRNPYTGEYPITEEEYQQVMDREPVNLGHGGMAGPLSKIEYKSAGGETYKLSYGGPISKGA